MADLFKNLGFVYNKFWVIVLINKHRTQAFMEIQKRLGDHLKKLIQLIRWRRYKIVVLQKVAWMIKKDKNQLQKHLKVQKCMGWRQKKLHQYIHISSLQNIKLWPKKEKKEISSWKIWILWEDSILNFITSNICPEMF